MIGLFYYANSKGYLLGFFSLTIISIKHNNAKFSGDADNNADMKSIIFDYLLCCCYLLSSIIYQELRTLILLTCPFQPSSIAYTHVGSFLDLEYYRSPVQPYNSSQWPETYVYEPKTQ